MKEINLVTPKRREMLENIDKQCAALHLPPPMKTFVTVTRMAQDGTPDLSIHDMAHTWNLNYYKMVGWMFMGADASHMANGGTNKKEWPQNFTLAAMDGSAGNLNQSPAVAAHSFAMSVGTFPNIDSLEEGIIIGGSADNDSIQTYEMAAQFKNAADWKIVLPSAASVLPTWNAAARMWTKKFCKTFQNINAAKVTYTITETGLAKKVGIGTINLDASASGTTGVSNNPNNFNKLFLFDRTKLAEEIAIPYQSLLRVDYDITFTLPGDVPMVMG